MEQQTFPEFTPDPQREAICRARLREYLTRCGQTAPDANVENLFAEVCSSDRYDYFAPRMPATTRRCLLVSGCSVGSEMIVARRYGFQEIRGTEVNALYAEIARERLQGQPGFGVAVYDGKALPYENDMFTAITSGHVIEHTPSPFAYFREHMRVLAPGGIMFLEFPDRYHPVELHTNLPSLEYLPLPLRALMLRYRASRFSRLPLDQRRYYDEVRRELRPVSGWQIRLFLRLASPRTGRLLHAYSPVPGFVRMLVRK